LEVFVERGAPHEHKVVFRNKADEQPGYEAGDVHFVLNEKPHPEFKRNKCDLTISRKITLLEALTGVAIEVTHLDGRKIIIKSKPGEVLEPQRNVDVEWDCFDDTIVADGDVASCKCPDATKLKEVCQQKGFSGFVLDTEAGSATFKDLSRDELLANMKTGGVRAKGKKLYVVPDPVLASAGRMRSCVKGEGMPVFKNSMLRGNLYIDIEIDFPKSIADDAAKKLRSILPGPDPMTVPDESDENAEICELSKGDPEASAKEFASFYEEEDDDEDGPRGRGGAAQQVQCAQQ